MTRKISQGSEGPPTFTSDNPFDPRSSFIVRAANIFHATIMDRYTPSSSSRDHHHHHHQMHRFGENRDARQSGAGDSYRPDNFSFRVSDNSAPRFPREQQGSHQHYDQRRAPSNRQSYNKNNRGGGGNNNSNNRDYQKRPYKGAKPQWRPPPPSERPLLRAARATTPEQLRGMVEAKARFKAVEDLSDSEEQAMQLDTDNDACNDSSEDERPRKKRAMTSAAVNGGDAKETPKWSNPDPYTVLPPTDEASGAKRKDFVGLIRKAKATEGGNQNGAGGDSTDFISFGFDDDEGKADSGSDSEEDLKAASPTAVIEAPTIAGSDTKFSHLNNLHPNRVAPGVSTASVSVSALGPPPSMLPGLLPNLPGAAQSLDVWPPPALPALPANPFSRKRGRDEIDDMPTNLQQEFAGRGKKRGSKFAGDIISEWQIRNKAEATPWCTVDHSGTEHMGHRLHKEILDFCEFAKPQSFENTMRHELVERIGSFLKRRYPDTEVRVFGSFATGLYLPNADMDLVVLSKNFLSKGFATTGQTKSAVRKFAAEMTNNRIAKSGSCMPISNAKVPIVKFVDAQSNLKVDISFENNTGLVANQTCNAWKIRYPAMPYIVILVKQFLAMRGLNEVFTGGLGGFSITCMVVSLLQSMPQLQSGNMDPMQNLGEIFMTFLDFYGNKFNTTTTGIQMNPPAFFSKVWLPKSKEAPSLLTRKSIRKGVCLTIPPSRGHYRSLIRTERRMTYLAARTTS